MFETMRPRNFGRWPGMATIHHCFKHMFGKPSHETNHGVEPHNLLGRWVVPAPGLVAKDRWSPGIGRLWESKERVRSRVHV